MLQNSNEDDMANMAGKLCDKVAGKEADKNGGA